MKERYSVTLGSLRIPKGIPLPEYDEVNEHIAKLTRDKLDVRGGFSSAWNGIVYRLISAEKYATAFSESIVNSSAPEPAERYLQDHSLFGFFTCAISSLDCLFFASYCAANLYSEAYFPIQSANDLRNISPKNVAENYRKLFPDVNISLRMQNCVSSETYREIKDRRDVLTHRGTPPRQHYFSTTNNDTPSSISANPRDLPSQWNYSIPLEVSTLRNSLDFLNDSQENLICAFRDFVVNTLAR